MSASPTGILTKPLGQVLFLAAILLSGHFIAYKITHLPNQLELVIIFAACMFYPVLRHPQFGVYLIFAILPFIPYVRRLYYLSYARPSADPLIAVGDIITALMIIGLFFEFRERSQNEDYLRRISLAIMLYFAYLVVRTPVLNILPLGEAFLRFRFYGPPVLLFFVGALYATRLRQLRALWVLTVIIGIISALYGLKQLYLGYSEAERLWFTSVSFSSLFIKGIARPFSFYQSPASFADYMQLTLIGVVVLTSWSRTPLRVVWFGTIPLLCYGALISSVRSNWIGIVLSMLLWASVIHVKGTRNRVLVVCGMLLAFFLFNLSEIHLHGGPSPTPAGGALPGGTAEQNYVDLLVTERVGAISNPFEEHSFLSRLGLWRYIVMLASDPTMAVFGRGVGALNADSLYITYLAEFGYPGMAFIIFISIYFIARGFALLDNAKSRQVAALAKGITVMNVAWAVVNVTGTHIHSFPGDVYYWFWNGVLLKLAAMGGDAGDGQEYAGSPDT